MNPITERLDSQFAGRYRFERELGAGGMATVYLAEDPKHHRRVAVKVLKPELSAVLGAERFLKEIEVTANLQHPHLLPLFDSGEADGLLYYVMPYVEGESLRQKLTRERQLSIEDAVRIATHVASALEYAHRRGVIHRDIKPENILLHDGQALIADFGIALALHQAGGNRLTQTGLSLGSPQYMSPEQAMGDQNVDQRADIYALGAVMYEMLTGEPPFTGATVQAIVAKVLTTQPERVTSIRPSVSPHVEAAVHKAIATLPADRFASVEQFAHALASPGWFTTTLPERGISVGLASSHWRQRAVIPLAGVALALAITVVWLAVREPDSVRAPDIHALIPTARPTDVTAQYRHFDISQDGRLLAYAQGTEGIFLRPLGSASASVIPDTRNAAYPAFSPDGQQLAFVRAGRLFRTGVTGGAHTEVARLTATAGLHWGADNYFYFASGLGTGGIWRVAMSGGTGEPVTSVRDDDRENAHTWPQLLPGGKAILYTALGPSGGATDSRVVAQRFGSDAPAVLVENAIYGRYLASGHLLYARDDGTLYAVRFNPRTLEASGEPAAIQAGVGTGVWGGAAFVVSSTDGTEVFLPRSDRPGNDFVLVDRSGKTISAAVDSVAQRRLGLGASGARFSPDGKRIVLTGRSPGSIDIWVVAGGSSTERLTLDAAEDEYPAWSPDGKSVAYTSANTGKSRRVFVKDVGAGGEPRLVRTWPRHAHLWAWSPDGNWLAISDYTHAAGQDIWAISLDGKDSLAVATGTATEIAGAFSPDGRWLAYVSDETGRNEVFVVSFPGMAIRRQVTTAGASNPRWDGSGGQLYYLSNGSVVALAVDLAGGFRTAGESVLFQSDATQFDVSRDGTRFLLQVPNPRPDHPPLHVRTNWFDEIRAKVK